jgi:hypothetical protein
VGDRKASALDVDLVLLEHLGDDREDHADDDEDAGTEHDEDGEGGGHGATVRARGQAAIRNCGQLARGKLLAMSVRWSMRRFVGLAIVIAALVATPAGAAVVTYKNVRSPSKQISCWAVKEGTGIECSAPYLPDIGPLDTYLALRPHGRAKLSERGDFSGYFAPFHTLQYGDTWKRPGVRCTMKTTGLTCHNRDRHGFHIQRGHVRRF